MTTIAERIKLIRGSLSQKAFAEEIATSQGTIFAWETGKSLPGAELLKKISEKFGVSVDWILFGREPRDAKEPERLDPEEFSHIPSAEARLSAGNGSVVLSENFDKKLAFRNDWLHKVATCKDNLVLMFVRGDSMHPTLQDWDLVMVDRGRTKPRSGHIFAINIGDDLLQIKRLFFIPPDKIRIVSDQGGIYPPYELNLSEMRIIGQVIWFARELPTE